MSDNNNEAKKEVNEEKKEESFNPRTFDQTIGDDLIRSVQARKGCFFCENPAASKKCTRCKVAIYCNQDCQKNDWKKDRHKAVCKFYCENRELETIPICLKGCYLIEESEFVDAMRQRRDLFLSALCSQSHADVSFSTALVYNLDAVYLAARARFIDDDWNIHNVDHVMMEPVDHGLEAKNRLYRGSGTLSVEAQSLVVSKWLEFSTLVHQGGGKISSLTFGQGLTDLFNDDSFKSQLKETGCNAAFMPSMDNMFG